MVKGASITVVADTINNEAAINKLEMSLKHSFPAIMQHQRTEVYSKFANAYKLEYYITVDNANTKETIMHQLLLIADCMAQPWLIYFDKEGDNTELIFNRDVHTKYQQEDFSVIRWAHIQLDC